MMHNVQGLYEQLRTALLEIERQIEAVKKNAEKAIGDLPYPMTVSVYDLKDGDGKFIMADLIVSRAQILSALATLKAADMQQRAKK